VANLSVDRIVAEAGIARATFYLHFSDKQALIARLAEDAVAWREEVGAEVLANPDLERAALDAIMLEIVSRWAEDRHVVSAIIELAEHDTRVHNIWSSAMHQVADKAATQFRARWKDSPVAPPDPDAIAEAFTWMFERCCHQMLHDASRVPLVAGAMAEIIWRVLDYAPRPADA
jgi:AcrR family transcriptional regulator